MMLSSRFLVANETAPITNDFYVDGPVHTKTLVSQGFTEKNQGFARVRAEGLEPSTQGLKVLCSTD